MTIEDLNAAFERHEDEFLKFHRIANPRHERPDLCAFLMLHDTVPGKRGHDMVSGAEHDEIFLDVDCEQFAAVATDEMVRDLHRCGVRYDDEVESLAIYV